MFGKFTLSKHFAVCLLASLLSVPPDVIKQIETILHDFLWGSRDKIKRTKVIQELKCGGLNIINVKYMFMSFKAVWISRLLSCDPSIHRWAQIASLYYEPFMECNNNLVFNFDESIDFPDLNNVSRFYQYIIIAFNAAYTIDEDDLKFNPHQHG